MSNNNIKIIVVIVVGVIFLIFYFFQNTDEEMYEDIYIEENQVTVENFVSEVVEEDIEKIKIHIIGKVKNPGIYELEEGARIQDAIIAAGGECEEADLNKVNLAYKLEDGQKIYIPSIFDKETAYIYNDGGENVVVSGEVSASINGKININKAGVEELQKINGVGPSLAEKIILYREENGNFKSIDELKNVSGIGDKKYEAIKEHVSIK